MGSSITQRVKPSESPESGQGTAVAAAGVGRPGWWRYGFALLTVGICAGVRWTLQPYWGSAGPYVVFVVAVLLTAWRAGLGPAILAMALSLALGSWLFVDGNHGWRLNIPAPALGAGLFVAGCAMFIWVMEAFQRAKVRAREEERQRHGRERELAEQGRLLDLSNDAIFVRDADGRIVNWNRGAEAIFGFRREEAVGRVAHELLDPELPEPLEQITAALRRDGAWSGKITYTCASGDLLCVHSRWVGDRTADGQLALILEIAHDISAEQRAEVALRESEQRFRSLAETVPALIWIAGVDKHCTWFNQRWLDFTGRTLVQEKGNGWIENVHLEDQERCLQTLMASFDGRQPFTMEFRLRRHDGEWRWLIDTGAPMYRPDGEFNGFIGSCMDVTERKQGEQALQSARDVAVAAARTKDDFLAMLSHELRTPLNPVLLVASEGAQDAALSEQTRSDFAMIASNIAVEARLIDDLLDLNRIARGKVALECEVLDLGELVRDAVATLRSDFAAKQIVLTVGMAGPEMRVLGDPVRLRQVLWNLLGNAVKFTPSGGSVHVTLRTITEGRAAEVRIRDSGIGMSREELSQMFEPFVQGAVSAAGGLGLGLAIARSLLERQGGRVWAESAGAGFGTEMIVTLPLSSESTPSTTIGRRRDRDEAIDSSGPGPLKGVQRVLLVEDHAPTQRSLAALLQQRGFAVEVAGSMQEARQRAGQASFDLLISDLGLPDGSGHSLMAELKHSQPGIAGIAISGYGMDTDVAASRAAGFSEHLVKPTAIAALERAMRRALQPREATEGRGGSPSRPVRLTDP